MLSPCVAGVILAPRGGVYDVDAETPALLMECFGFAEAEAISPMIKPKPRAAPQRGKTPREA